MSDRPILYWSAMTEDQRRAVIERAHRERSAAAADIIDLLFNALSPRRAIAALARKLAARRHERTGPTLAGGGCG